MSLLLAACLIARRSALPQCITTSLALLAQV
jgi:hypothetical protein